MSEGVDLAGSATNADEKSGTPFAVRGAILLEKIGLTGRVFYDESSNKFYVQDHSGEWRGRDSRTFAIYLKYMGLLPVTRNSKDAKEKISELDHVLGHISLNCSVQYAGAIAGFRKGLIENNGQRVLVMREARIMKPAPGDPDPAAFPVLWELLNRMFGMCGTYPEEEVTIRENDGPIQLPYFLGWWKHALQCLHGGYTDKRCLCMVFAGDAGCGKSLLKDLVSLSLGGRECKPYRFMIGQENFNGEFIGSELWVIDDEQASTRHRDRSEFGANIKKAVADRYYRIRGMMRDGVILEMFRLMLICVNREPERLMVLPPLEDDIADKIAVLMAHKHPMPMPAGTPDEKTAFWSTLVDELPHFINWLLNDYEIEPDMYGRFGVTHFHHPDLCSDLFHMSPARVLLEQIERVLKFDEFTWHYALGATELRGRMADDESSPLSRKEINDLPAPTYMGSQLNKIKQVHPDRLTQKKINGSLKWIFCAPGRSIDDAIELARRAGRASAGQAQGGSDD